MIDFTAGRTLIKAWAKEMLFNQVNLNAVKTWLQETLAKRPKLTLWLTLSVAATAAVLWLAPAMAGPALYKFAVTGLSIVWLYWLSRHIWPHSHPSLFMVADGEVKQGQEIPYAAALLAQALFIAIAFHGLAGLV